MTEKLDLLFGTKILNRQTNEIGLLIKTWKNEFADGSIWFATCVDKKRNVIISNLIKLCQWRKLMILKNKLTRKILEITYSEFRKKFAKEIQDIFEGYRKTLLNKQPHWKSNRFGSPNFKYKYFYTCDKRKLDIYVQIFLSNS